LGGSSEKNVWDRNPSEKLTKDILKRFGKKSGKKKKHPTFEFLLYLRIDVMNYYLEYLKMK